MRLFAPVILAAIQYFQLLTGSHICIASQEFHELYFDPPSSSDEFFFPFWIFRDFEVHQDLQLILSPNEIFERSMMVEEDN